MRNGVYAGPVTEGNAVVTVLNEPSSRRRASAGNDPSSMARFRTSGRAPSARRMTTDNRYTVESGTKLEDT